MKKTLQSKTNSKFSHSPTNKSFKKSNTTTTSKVRFRRSNTAQSSLKHSKNKNIRENSNESRLHKNANILLKVKKKIQNSRSFFANAFKNQKIRRGSTNTHERIKYNSKGKEIQTMETPRENGKNLMIEITKLKDFARENSPKRSIVSGEELEHNILQEIIEIYKDLRFYLKDRKISGTVKSIITAEMSTMKEYAEKNTFNFVEMIRNLLNVLFTNKKTELKKLAKINALLTINNLDDYLFLVEDMLNNLDVMRSRYALQKLKMKVLEDNLLNTIENKKEIEKEYRLTTLKLIEDIETIDQIVKEKDKELEELSQIVLKKDLVIDGYMIKDVNLKVMGKKLRKMDHFYNQILERLAHKHDEEALEYERKIAFMTKKLAEYSDLPKNMKTLKNVKTLVSMTHLSPTHGKLSSNSKYLYALQNLSGLNNTKYISRSRLNTDNPFMELPMVLENLKHEEKLLRSYQKFIEVYEKTKQFTESNRKEMGESTLRRRAKMLYDRGNAHISSKKGGRSDQAAYRSKSSLNKNTRMSIIKLQLMPHINRFDTLESKDSFQHIRNSSIDKKIILNNNKKRTESKEPNKITNHRRLLAQARDNSDRVFQLLDKEVNKSKYKPKTILVSVKSNSDVPMPSLQHLLSLDDKDSTSKYSENRIILKLNGKTLDSSKILEKYDTLKRLQKARKMKSRIHLTPQKVLKIEKIEKNMKAYSEKLRKKKNSIKM